MNDQNNLEEAAPAKGCINCGSPAILQGYPNALCESCREGFIKYPVPLWIKIFAAAIGLIFVFSLYKIPKNIALGMHLDKGEKAMDAKRYLTAEKELKIALRASPENLELQSKLMISSFYNGDLGTYDSLVRILQSKNFEDQDLFSKVSTVVSSANNYYPQEAFGVLYARYNNDLAAIPDTALEAYTAKNPADLYMNVFYAGKVYDTDTLKADALLSRALGYDPDYYPALVLKAGVKRMFTQLDSSMYYCDKALAINRESTYALSSKARTCLRAKNDADAVKYANEAYVLNEADYYSMATMALTDHYTKKTAERDQILGKLRASHDSDAVTTLKYVDDVISGKEPFRN